MGWNNCLTNYWTWCMFGIHTNTNKIQNTKTNMTTNNITFERLHAYALDKLNSKPSHQGWYEIVESYDRGDMEWLLDGITTWSKATQTLNRQAKLLADCDRF